MKRFITVASMLVLTAGLSFAAEYTGFVTDAKCAAGGKAGAGHAGCAKSCITGGEAAVIVTADGKVLEVSNQDKVTALAGEKVKVTGTEADGKLTVTAIEKAS
ncbi:MAG: hypothetical protein O3A53_17625 [Acidobacteria bacterium]|nr:hypothetical protein [Acidobacteriota bacterium]MDA1236608.1 hypothetical protein [Acidobacteriota bacterium]